MEKPEMLVRDLTARPVEEEWFEFKENWYRSRELGEYISCLSNAAAFKGVGAGYLIWGVKSICFLVKSHLVAGETHEATIRFATKLV